MRLNRLLSACGVSSRREADELIRNGAVTVNGTVVSDPATAVEPDDWVKFQGKTLRLPKPVYYVYYKPKQMITTMDDPEGRPCIGDVVARLPGHLFPVGRLDWHSEGLLVLTNDGEMAHLLSHPGHDLDKVYHVKIRGTLDPEALKRLVKGLVIDGKINRMKSIRPLKQFQTKHSWWEVVLVEGKSRQIRRMLKKTGRQVLKLKRVRIGPLSLGNLKAGEYRTMNSKELTTLKRLINMGGDT